MSAPSKLIADNSNSPHLFCYEQSPQVTESEDSKKSSKNPRNSVRNNLEDESTPGPGAYNPQSAMRAVYRSSPAYTFRSKYDNRYRGLYDGTPGPAYFPKITRYSDKEVPWSKPCVGGFGIKHSWWRAPFLVKYK